MTTWRRHWHAAVEDQLATGLAAAETLHLPLADALRHAVLGPGKRLRPLLCLAATRACGGAEQQALVPACAVELIHAYSLVHDDLPAMDDDDLRRGQPTVHKAFDEATAILAGDGLQALAFAWLASAPGLDAEVRIAMVADLARAAGPGGMVGGQALDMAQTGTSGRIVRQTLEAMHRGKTGALLASAVQLGVLAAHGTTPGDQASTVAAALAACAEATGLAFQVRDDVLDATADTATLGKTAGADTAQGKSTFPALMGLAAAQGYAKDLTGQALAALAPLGTDADELRALVGYILTRDS